MAYLSDPSVIAKEHYDTLGCQYQNCVCEREKYLELESVHFILHVKYYFLSIDTLNIFSASTLNFMANTEIDTRYDN